MKEILQQLRGGVSHYLGFQLSKVVQDFFYQWDKLDVSSNKWVSSFGQQKSSCHLPFSPRFGGVCMGVLPRQTRKWMNHCRGLEPAGSCGKFIGLVQL